MIRYLIVDDEHIAHEVIKGYCDLLPNFTLSQSCYDAIEALDFLHKQEVDLIFLDLNMPKLKGFEFLKTLTYSPKVIVTTAYSEYALEGYELNIVDYLLKPFSFERFLKAVNKAKFDTPSALDKSKSKEDHSKASIFIQQNKKYIQVVIDTLLFLESAGNYTKIITNTGSFTTREKITDLLALLPESEFIRVHKSFAVAIKHIKSIEGNRIMIQNHIIPIGKVYRTNVLNIL